MKFSFFRALQWVGIAVFLMAIVGLNFDFDSKAGKTMNAPVEDSIAQSLLGYWKMDEGTGTTTTSDASGNGTTLTMTAMESGDWAAGQIGPFSLDFDGTAEWLTASDPSSGILDFPNERDFTITGWFNRDTATTDDTIVAKRNGIANTDDGYIVYIDDATDQIIFEVSEAGGTDEYQVVSTSAFTTTGWNHFAAVWDDGSAAHTEIYINGAADNGTDTGTIGNLGDLSNAVAFNIGSESDNGNPFDGKLDDIRVYGYPLSAGEILKLAQTTAPTDPNTSLVGHWTFDGNDVSWADGTAEIKDVSGKGNHGDAVNLTRSSVTPGKLGQGLQFNGTSDEVDTVNTINWTGAFSWAFWIKTTDTNNETIGWGPYRWCRFGLIANKISCTVGGDDANGVFSSAVVNNGAWHHIVYTSTTNAQILYVDGVQEGTASETASTEDYTFVLGTRQFGGYSKSILDDVRFYSRVLSATEIADLYNMGK